MKAIRRISFLIVAAFLSSSTQLINNAAFGQNKSSVQNKRPAGRSLRHAAVSTNAKTVTPARTASPYLFVWTGDEDRKDSDFLAVIDAHPSSPTFGEIIATLPVGVSATGPHHTEYEFPAGSILFANGWRGRRTFIIDLKNPKKPRLVSQFTDSATYGFPHSFARLPNGNVLATFQVKSNGYQPPGGLVELDARGKFLRESSADVAGIDNKRLLWPYSLIVLPKINRVISTSTEMGLPAWASSTPHGAGHQHTSTDTNHIQIWSLRDLRLRATIPLPPAPDGKAQFNPAEPRVLRDGTVYVNTFNCGLYRVVGLTTSQPKAEFVHSFAGSETDPECGVPVVVGKFWIQTHTSLPGLIALDVSNPAKPIEVSRLIFDSRFEKAHWVAADRRGNRVVVTGAPRSWLLVVNVDPDTGKLSVDENFKDTGADVAGINFDRQQWPHGPSGKGLVHGALFGPTH